MASGGYFFSVTAQGKGFFLASRVRGFFFGVQRFRSGVFGGGELLPARKPKLLPALKPKLLPTHKPKPQPALEPKRGRVQFGDEFPASAQT